MDFEGKLSKEILNILPYDGDALLLKGFVQSQTKYFDELKNSIRWHQGQIKMYGKLMNEGRLTAWYGDTNYKYSGKVNTPNKWTPELIEVKNLVEQIGKSYNLRLLNYYRHGSDSIGMHSDDEKALDTSSGIASLSFGGSRDFVFRHKEKNEKITVQLDDGDLLLMLGDTQKYWKHGVPKRTQADARINLTFRRTA